ncbi:Aromatic amino acid lyase [Dethiosulfatibacter aminovorans DSM 17477]|uniref:Aromatic amino acid lyase n=1 Tax=Dethiosulfatibacter aminovorans DSM 17477 TaxID=1121476 RepID=A0A1M6AB10_9FIRM|nr:aromatic amino acid lyase [Dethiosulfatibacter aminovorans]SHI33682.1 Aromatic amino acid lyase [Dethiosulfatibacter aminovorans DSM 17477]
MKKLIDFNFLSSLVTCEKTLMESHYPESITRIILHLLADSTKETTKHDSLVKLTEGTLPQLPLSLSVEMEIVLFFEKFLKEKDLEIMDPSSLLHKILPISFGIYTYVRAMEISKAADLGLSLNLEAIRGEKGAFDLRLHSEGKQFVQQYNSAENTLRLLEGSNFTEDEGRYQYGYDDHPRCQDAISYRSAPQTHGGARDVFCYLKDTLKLAVDEGTYLPEQLRYALDLTMAALSDLGNISERRSFRLNGYQLSYGLPPNMVYHDPGYNYGFAVTHAIATAVLGELKSLSIPTRSNIDCSMNSSLPLDSALRTVEGTGHLSKIISIEMFMSCQGMDIVKSKLPHMDFGKGTGAAYSKIRENIHTVRENRYITPELQEMDRLIFTGELIAAVEESTGKLK